MKKFFLLFVVTLISAVSFAQVTTSSISGKVTAENGEPLIGATVIAVHNPSGTEYGAATNIDGRYTISGMRTGGPYTVTMTYVGYQGVEFTDIYLKLGESFSRNGYLKESQAIDEVVVVSSASDRFNSSKTGAGASFSSSAIATAPTVDRSVFDVVKMTPQANVSQDGGIVFAGASNRYNSFQVDGSMNNDVFGLSDTGTNGGQSSPNPVSLDAIETIQVVVAPFDVRQSGFTGGAINAVTKSGTNQFKGSLYSYFNNQNTIGSTPGAMGEGETREKLTDQMTNTFGLTAGGPIIEDKLFFFVSAEYYNQSRPTTYKPGEGFISQEDVDLISETYKKLTGIDDTLSERTLNTNSKDFLARIDWNINKNNNLMFRYQIKDATKDDGYASYKYINFNNSGFTRDNSTQSWVLELNSRISNEMSNELRAGYTRVRDIRTPGTPDAPTIVIKNIPNTTGSQVNLGLEYSSGLNQLDQDIFTLTDNFSIYKGNHSITIGTHNEVYGMANGFLQNANGAYTYSSIADFVAGNASSYAINYCDPKYTNGDRRWMASFNAAQFGLYVQDEWKPTTEFTFTYGLRADLPVMFTTPQENEEFNNSAISNNGEYKVGRAFKSRVLWSPRIGFRYMTDDEHTSLIRGGVGIFTGRVPFVWFSNIYGNTGLEIKKLSIYGEEKVPEFTTTPDLASFNGKNTSVNTIDENFRLPQVFRANVAWEKSFNHGWHLTLEALYSKTLNNVSFRNVAYEHTASFYPVAMGVGTPAPRYSFVDSSNAIQDAIHLENTNKGYTYDLSAMVAKSFAFGLDLSASYSFGHSYSVNDAGSSVAYSNWYKNISVDANSNSELGFSRYDIPHRINVSATYNSPMYANGRLNTVVGLTYQGYSGARYSLGYSEYNMYVNGDAASNTLLYIPTDAELEQMTFVDANPKYDGSDFTAEEARAAFTEFCQTDKYAKEHRGEWAERYGSQNPFEHHFNLHISENFIYNKAKNSKIQLSADILNVGNLLNREWGLYNYQPYPGVSVLTVKSTKDKDGNKIKQGSSADATATYAWNGETVDIMDFTSRWRMQLGLRITF